jgi:hypothetical protein
VRSDDQRLHDKRIDGYRFADMPPDGEAHQLGLQAIGQMSRELFGREFLELTWLGQEELLKLIHDGSPKRGTAYLAAFTTQTGEQAQPDRGRQADGVGCGQVAH